MSIDLQREVVDYLKGYGAKNIRVVPSGKHPRIKFNFKGEEKFTVVPSTASDHRAIANQLADIRRKLGPPVPPPTLVKRKLEEMMPAVAVQQPKRGTDGPRHFAPFSNAPGSFEMVPLRDLHVDERYQRIVNKGAVARIARNWSWPSCGVLLVSKRHDDRYFIFDGQHRWEAAKLSTGEPWGQEIPALPCLVFEALPLKDEAINFLGANTERRVMYLAHQYNALLMSGDALAKKAEELAEVAKRKVSVTAGPNTISCISRVMQSLRTDEEALRRVWPTICALMEGRLFHERIVKGVFELERRMPDGLSLSERRFLARLLSVGADTILREIKNIVAIEGNAGQRVVAMGVARAYNRGNKAPLRINFDR
jgi:hypothetical protein